MAERDFRRLLEARWDKDLFLCVGLDSDLEKIPEAARRRGVRETLRAFNRAVIDATADLVCAYKPNSAFYEARGEEGWRALRETVEYIHRSVPEVPVILDSKRADIGNTNRGYAEAFFDDLKVDAITLPSFLGREAVQPFLDRKEKGMFVLCRTSNPGAGEFQDLKIEGEPLYALVARHVAKEWNANGNCGLVVGATYPGGLREVRRLAPNLPILLPGVGAQNGDLEASVRAGKDARGRGLVVSASRTIIFASGGEDFADAARGKAQELSREISGALLQ